MDALERVCSILKIANITNKAVIQFEIANSS
jgi:hypothetical protein